MSAQAALGDESAPSPAAAFEARKFSGDDGGELRYRLLTPLETAPDQKYPLLLFLHGAGERGDDNEKQLVHGGRNFAEEALRRRHPAFVVVPQCPEGKTWAPFRRTDGDADKPAEAPLELALRLVASLQAEFPVDSQRIYVMGLSMGGYGTWDILSRKPDLAAAAVPICGGGRPERAAAFQSIPIWVFHGDKDDAVPVERSREMVQALQAAGGQPIFTEYAGVGHDSWTRTFDNQLMWDWLFAQRRK